MARSAKLSDALRRLGNPYASLQVKDEEMDSSIVVADSSRATQFRLSENPYAWHFYFGDDAPESPALTQIAPAPAVPSSGELSKSAFRDQVRAIFRPYIPAAEHGKLRDHHREFIARNESRAPRVRYQLVAQLRKYDLSNLSGMKPLFNREEAAFTKEKLAEIERVVGSDD